MKAIYSRRCPTATEPRTAATAFDMILAARAAGTGPAGALARCAVARRVLCGGAKQPPTPAAGPADAGAGNGPGGVGAACFGAGAAGGMLGGLVGLGGGAVMVPLMTALTAMSQHVAVGTSSAAVAMTGLSGAALPVRHPARTSRDRHGKGRMGTRRRRPTRARKQRLGAVANAALAHLSILATGFPIVVEVNRK